MSPFRPARRAGFTLIEIMVVVGIFAVVLGMSAPAFFRAKRGEPMRLTCAEIVEVCSNARARAILGGQTAGVVFRPGDRTFAVDGAADSNAGKLPGSGLAGVIREELGLEMLDVNLAEYRDAESVRVRFFPNGTADELTLVLSGRGEWQKITVDPITGFAKVGPVQ